MRFRSAMLAAVFCLSTLATAPGQASPWAEVGDNQLRSDIELLQAAGVLSTITIQWPIPWQSLSAQLRGANLESQPAGIRAAAARLLAQASAQTAQGTRASAFADFTNKASVIYGFDGMGRGDGQAQVSLSGTSGAFSGRMSVGLISNNFGGKPNKLMLDGTYGAVDVWGVRLYAGYLDHWWGPGEISALQLSNNARPMPQIGFERSSTQASSWPVLRWLGPWQFGFFIGKLDGPQRQSNVYYDAAHLTISPLPGLELGIAKTEEICGQGHPCAPLRDYFQNMDFSTHPNNVNGEGSFEFKYSNALGGIPFEVHMQMMNEDYSLVNHSGTSHMIGTSLFAPVRGESPVKLTAEYADSIATLTMLDFSQRLYGFTYNDGQYPDGMRYRGRTLGFSLDDDSTLLSLQSSWSDDGGRFYELTLHHATISTSHTSAGANVVTSVPAKLNLAEARVSVPLRWGIEGAKLDVVGQVQDRSLSASKGPVSSVEVAIRADL